MRMAGPDLVLFVVGALLFGGASYAIVQQGGLAALTESHSPVGQFTVTYDTHLTPVGDAQPVADFRNAEATFDVNATNVAKVVVTIACTDAQGAAVAPFTLQITVTGPNITADPVSAPCGADVEVPIDVTPVPTQTTVPGDTESEARENLPADANATKAQGTWTVSVTGGRSAGGTLPVPGQIPGPTGEIALATEQWEPHFAAVLGK